MVRYEDRFVLFSTGGVAIRETEAQIDALIEAEVFEQYYDRLLASLVVESPGGTRAQYRARARERRPIRDIRNQ